MGELLTSIIQHLSIGHRDKSQYSSLVGFDHLDQFPHTSWCEQRLFCLKQLRFRIKLELQDLLRNRTSGMKIAFSTFRRSCPPSPPSAPPTPPSSPCSLPSQSTIALKYTQTASWPRRRRAGRKRWGHLSTDTWVKECFF